MVIDEYVSIFKSPMVSHFSEMKIRKIIWRCL